MAKRKQTAADKLTTLPPCRSGGPVNAWYHVLNVRQRNELDDLKARYHNGFYPGLSRNQVCCFIIEEFALSVSEYTVARWLKRKAA